MRRFMVLREEDATGVSGTGHVADGVVFADGKVAIRWRTATASTALYDSIDDARAVHGHGKTSFVFHDDEAPVVWLCCLCFADMDLPVNHCFQCGAGGSAVAMSPSQLEYIQRHDEQRLEAWEKQNEELKALRRVAFEMLGAVALGLRVERGIESRELLGVKSGRVIACVTVKAGETDEEYLARGAESAPLDPAVVRRALAQRGGDR